MLTPSSVALIIEDQVIGPAGRGAARATISPDLGAGSMRKAAGDSGRAILRSLLARLRDERQAPMAAQVLEDAERRLFLHEYETFHAELRERDPEGWAELEEERRAFDGTLLDGLRDE